MKGFCFIVSEFFHLASYMSTSLSTRRDKVSFSNHNNHRIDEEQDNDAVNDDYESK